MKRFNISIMVLAMTLVAAGAEAGPRTPEQAWRQMQGGAHRRITPVLPTNNRGAAGAMISPRVRNLQGGYYINRMKKPAKKGMQLPAIPQITPEPNAGQKKEPKKQPRPLTTPAAKGPQPKAVPTAPAKGRLAAALTRIVGKIRKAVARHREARKNKAPPNTPLSQFAHQLGLTTEALVGGVRLNQLKNISQGTLYSLRQGKIITETEYQTILRMRTGLPIAPASDPTPQVTVKKEEPQLVPPPASFQ